VVQIADTAVWDIARGTMVITTLQTESITAVILSSAHFFGRALTVFFFRVCTSLSVERQLLERRNFAFAGLLKSFMRVEARSSGCSGSSAAVVGAMHDEMVAILGVVSLVLADSSLMARDGWFQVRLIVFESSGSSRNIIIISVVTCLSIWNHANGGGNAATGGRHGFGVESTHLAVDAR